MPKTILGKWSLGLIGGFFLLLIVFFILVASGQRGGDTFFSNLALALPMTVAGACAVAALVVGLVGVIKQRERSPLVFLAMLVGVFVVWWIIGVLAFPE